MVVGARSTGADAATNRHAMPLFEIWRMPRARYDAMVASGALEEDDPIELLDGLLVVKERQTPRHAVTASVVERTLSAAFGRGYHTRTHAPIALDDMSEPEPDVSVV